MTLNKTIKCPYCGFDILYKTENHFDTQLVTCPLEDGGCDRMLVVKSVASINTTIYKVEGQDNDD